METPTATVTVARVIPEPIESEICEVEPMEQPLSMQIYANWDEHEGRWTVRHIGSFHVTIAKDELLKALRANLQKHKEEFETAFRGYRNLCVKELRRRAREVKAGNAGDPRSWMRFDLQPPRNHERDYKQLIDMLEMAQEEEFKIDGTQFRQWVKDEWEWKDDFESTTAMYLAHS